jgi:hypothetical protein
VNAANAVGVATTLVESIAPTAVTEGSAVETSAAGSSAVETRIVPARTVGTSIASRATVTDMRSTVSTRGTAAGSEKPTIGELVH